MHISKLLRRLRQVVQVLAFLLYIYLLFAALQRRAAFPLADLFFRLDPLAALGAMLASRAWIPRMALALVTLVLTLLLGRVWCGWLCPLGTLLDWIRFPRASSRAASISPRWRTVKYVLLILIVVGALFGNLSLMIFDPITIFTRTMTVAVLPALNYAVTAAESALYPLPIARPAINWIESVMRGPVFPAVQPFFEMGVFVLLTFVAIVALNALADRFWCRYLCPLGGLLGLLSKVSLIRPAVRAACNRCGQCGGVCPTGALDTSGAYQIVPSECIFCLDCLATCAVNEVKGQAAEGGIGFEVSWRPAPAQPYDPTRRQVLQGLVVGAAGVALLRTTVRAGRPPTYLIRPPGVEDEGEFLARCIRCSQCMKVCPTSGLQPAVTQAGLEGFGSPVLVPRLGECDYSCTACGSVCPTGAIPLLDLERKRLLPLGVAVIDRNRCLPWARGVPCIVCEEVCPVPDKAIHLEAAGDAPRPVVLAEHCIGCGICENQCPVAGDAAIRVQRRE